MVAGHVASVFGGGVPVASGQAMAGNAGVRVLGEPQSASELIKERGKNGLIHSRKRAKQQFTPIRVQRMAISTHVCGA